MHDRIDQESLKQDQDLHDSINRVIAQVNTAVTNTGVYSFSHPQVAQSIDRAFEVLTGMLKERPELTVMLIGDDLVAENRPLSGEGGYISTFVRILRKRAVERITFLTGMPRQELEDLIRELASSGGKAIRSSAFIKLGKVELRVRQDAAAGHGGFSGEASPEVMDELLALTTAELDQLKEIYFNAKRHKQINVQGVDEVVKQFIRGFRQEVNPLRMLASLKASHEYTFTHVVNVGILTMSQAEAMGFTGMQLHHIGMASLLHDIGKMFVPEELLSKPGMLTQKEREIVETHTVKGARFLMGLEGVPKLAVLSALEHHLKFDGTGYPSIKGGWIPNIASQIISIADVFDAMRSRRSYQEPHPVEKIEGVLRKGSGKAFNPKLVDHFLRLIKK